MPANKSTTVKKPLTQAKKTKLKATARKSFEKGLQKMNASDAADDVEFCIDELRKNEDWATFLKTMIKSGVFASMAMAAAEQTAREANIEKWGRAMRQARHTTVEKTPASMMMKFLNIANKKLDWGSLDEGAVSLAFLYALGLSEHTNTKIAKNEEFTFVNPYLWWLLAVYKRIGERLKALKAGDDVAVKCSYYTVDNNTVTHQPSGESKTFDFMKGVDLEWEIHDDGAEVTFMKSPKLSGCVVQLNDQFSITDFRYLFAETGMVEANAAKLFYKL